MCTVGKKMGMINEEHHDEHNHDHDEHGHDHDGHNGGTCKDCGHEHAKDNKCDCGCK